MNIIMQRRVVYGLKDAHRSIDLLMLVCLPLINSSPENKGRGLDEGTYLYMYISSSWSWESSVGIATGYGLDDGGVGVRVPVGSRISSSPRRPHRFWGPHSHLSNEYRGLFSRGKAARA
jgi:hypothetical protein